MWPITITNLEYLRISILTFISTYQSFWCNRILFIYSLWHKHFKEFWLNWKQITYRLLSSAQLKAVIRYFKARTLSRTQRPHFPLCWRILAKPSLSLGPKWDAVFSDLDKQCSAFNWKDQSFSLKIPCFETRNDGLDNIIGALILAGFRWKFWGKKNNFLGYV